MLRDLNAGVVVTADLIRKCELKQCGSSEAQEYVAQQEVVQAARIAVAKEGGCPLFSVPYWQESAGQYRTITIARDDALEKNWLHIDKLYATWMVMHCCSTTSTHRNERTGDPRQVGRGCYRDRC